MKRDLVCVHNHHKCQNFSDNRGDNKRSRVEQDRTPCILPTTSSVINSMSMNKIWNFLASNETRLCMHSLSSEISRILLTIVVIINLVEWIKSEHGAYFLPLQVSSTQSQWTRLRALFHLMERDLLCFHYHRKCQYITDNCGDNEIVLVE